MIDNLGDLRLFMAVLAAGSLSEAARRGNLSLTSVSRRLAGFENRLGVRLIDRSAQKFHLTAEGELLKQRAGPILDAADATSAELASLSGAVLGKLRISAPIVIGRRQIAAICRSFTECHSQTEIELVLTDNRPDVHSHDLDLAIQTKRPTTGETVHRRLLHSRRVICAAPSYLADKGTPTTPDDLASHNCIRMRRGARLYDQWRLRWDGEIRMVDVSGSLIANSTDTVLEWVKAGAGIAMKALWDIEDELARGDLIELLPDCACDDINLYATYSDRRNLPIRIRHFLDHLTDKLPQLLDATGSTESRIVD